MAQRNLGEVSPNAAYGHRPDSDFPDTLLSRHYLTKQSSLDKRGLTVVSCPDLFAGNHLLTMHAKTCERMLSYRVVYGNNCGVVWILCTTWCSPKAARHRNNREFAALLHTTIIYKTRLYLRDCFIFGLCIYDLVFLFRCLFAYFCDLVFLLLLVFFCFAGTARHHFWWTKKFKGYISADCILRVPNQPSSKCKKNIANNLQSLLDVIRVMITHAEFHFSWVCTFSATFTQILADLSNPSMIHRERPAATQHSLYNCVEHLRSSSSCPSHTCNTTS